MLNSRVFAPMPIASETMATALKPGLARSMRKANRTVEPSISAMSCANGSTLALLISSVIPKELQRMCKAALTAMLLVGTVAFCQSEGPERIFQFAHTENTQDLMEIATSIRAI